MKNIRLFFFIAALVGAVGQSAFAESFCPAAADTGGFGSDTFTSVASTDAACSDVGVNLSISVSTDYARLQWAPTDLTLGTLTGLTASVIFTSGSASDQPYYEFTLQDPTDALGLTNPTDQLLLLEFQPTTIAGGDMDVDPNGTLFNLYDNTTGKYLLGGQSDAQTIAYWDAMFPSLGSEAITGLRIGEGLSGGCNGPCSESLTIDSLDATSIAATPEPPSAILFGIGMLVVGVGVAFDRRRRNLLRVAA